MSIDRSRKILTEMAGAILLCLCLLCVGAAFPAEAKTKAAVTVGGKNFDAVFEDNASAKAFLDKCPMSITMSELNGNEKYHYLEEELPSAAVAVGKIEAGDIMLYGSDCIVIFYESFSTGYKYTRLGRITDPDGLAEAAGTGSVKVRFAAAKKIALNRKTITLKKKKTFQLKLKNASAGKVKWKSSNKKIATVSAKGRVKAKKKGKATITATYRSKKYRCRVKVKG